MKYHIFKEDIISVFHCCRLTNGHKLINLREHIYYLSVSTGQGSCDGLAKFSDEGFTRLQPRC